MAFQWCSFCGGTGKETCQRCKGTGEVNGRVNYNKSYTCSECGGSGKVNCSWCNGTGQIYTSDKD